MRFHPPSWLPKLPTVPDTITIAEFMLDEKHGRQPFKHSKNPFTCGISGRTFTSEQVKERVDYLARGIAKEMGWQPNTGTEWDKVVGVFSINSLYNVPLAWAAHRLGGLQTPANAAYSREELEHQLRDSGAQCLFTCLPLLKIAEEAAQNVGLPKNRIFLIDLPKQITGGQVAPSSYKTVEQFIQDGSKQPPLEPLKWNKGDGAKKVAFLCYSSGTSGLPKGVMISHRNVIANTLQIKTFEQFYRDSRKAPGAVADYTEVGLGLLPMSHIYSLVVICHASVYRGDSVVVLPKFEFLPLLAAIEKFKIQSLFLVPPIVIIMAKNKDVLAKYDLSSAYSIFTGAAPLGKETAEELQAIYPHWVIRQGYGLTETCTVVCSSSGHDIWFGSSGSLLPGFEAKVVNAEGQEVTGYDQPGELVVRSPSVTLGYLNAKEKTEETYEDGWMKTGDEVVVRKAPSGYEHIFINDRLKELIKVKGHQVAPAELEAHLLTHPAVADCAVIQIPDEMSGEIPKAFVVKSPSVGANEDEQAIARDIQKHVEKTKAKYKWITGGIEFIDAIPKSPSGKILRRFLRDKEKERRRKEGARL